METMHIMELIVEVNMFKNTQVRNILWMFIDKAYLLVGGFIVSVMVARYLGPKQLGLISYGVALSTLIVSLAQWGANYTIFDTAVKNVRRSIGYIKNTEKIRLIIYFSFYILISALLYFDESYSTHDYALVVLVLLSQVFLALDIYQYHYNALLMSKINAKSSMIAKSLSMFMRFALIYFELGVIYFVIPFFIEGAIIYSLRKKALVFNKNMNSNITYKKSYFFIGSPLVITGVCVVIYTKIYEVMLANLSSYESVGIYSVAFVLNYAWSFVPMSIGISLLSKPMKEKDSNEMLIGYSFVTLMCMVSSVPILIIIYFLSDYIIDYTFGGQYIESTSILFIMALGTMFSTLAFITNRMMNSVQGGSKYILKKVMISAIIMIPICYILVREYGVVGAAIGYLLAEFLNFTVLNYFFKGVNVLKLQLGMLGSCNYYLKYL